MLCWRHFGRPENAGKLLYLILEHRQEVHLLLVESGSADFASLLGTWTFRHSPSESLSSQAEL